jgi:hypothetical protein
MAPVFTQVTANDCLFAAAANKALIHLEGPDGEEQMKKVFGWAGKRNTYGGFDNLLEQQSAGEMVRTLKYDPEAWKRFGNEEPEPRFVQVKFELPPLTQRALSQAVPEEFRARTEPNVDLQGTGVAVEQLPRPGAGADRSRTGPSESIPGDEPRTGEW